MESVTNAVELIEELKLQIISLEKEIKDLKNEKLKTMIDAETQYESLTLVDEFNLYKENNRNDSLSIADMIRETSESYLSQSGYCYDEKTGLYYHSQSGYYYDPTNSLFYNPKNGCYYSYDADTQEYKFHSQDDIEELSRKEKELLWVQGYQHKPPKEIISKLASKGQEKQKLAPCMRLINEDTGELSIITCSGGSIGSNKTINHTVIVDNMNEKEINLQVFYDTESCHYLIYRDKTDTADSCSMLNDSAVSKIPKLIEHHSRLVIQSELHLLIHIHEDFGTCDWCEPGQVRGKLKTVEDELDSTHEAPVFKRSKMYVVNQLKVKYGLKGSGNGTSGFWRTKNPNSKSNYIDRALIRRNKEKEEKTQEISEPNNAALKMMSKMGWNPGDSLGKSGTGITEPIKVNQRLNSRAGFGCENLSTVPVETDFKTVRKIRLINATQKRYNALFEK